jgi:hypothetical protein
VVPSLDGPGSPRSGACPSPQSCRPSTTLVVWVRCRAGSPLRCGRCGQQAGGYDRGGGARRWPHVDVRFACCVREGPAQLVRCGECGPTVAAVPWARHDTVFTRAFEDTVVHDAVRSGSPRHPSERTSAARLAQLRPHATGPVLSALLPLIRTNGPGCPSKSGVSGMLLGNPVHVLCTVATAQPSVGGSGGRRIGGQRSRMWCEPRQRRRYPGPSRWYLGEFGRSAQPFVGTVASRLPT